MRPRHHNQRLHAEFHVSTPFIPPDKTLNHQDIEPSSGRYYSTKRLQTTTRRRHAPSVGRITSVEGLGVQIEREDQPTVISIPMPIGKIMSWIFVDLREEPSRNRRHVHLRRVPVPIDNLALDSRNRFVRTIKIWQILLNSHGWKVAGANE